MERDKRIKKSIIIYGIVLAVILVVAVLVYVTGGKAKGVISGGMGPMGDYIAVLYIEGTIAADDEFYDHGYALDTIDSAMDDKKCKALLLYVDTPGGGVYESDELYLKICEYKATTGHPVYAYMGNQATSGGYYISAPADRIIANRNCWTGSIGVTIGNVLDISGFLDKHGIKVETITSGRNKAMGDIMAPMTEEQKKIFQSLVDDAYDQFVGVVSEGRNLDESYVRKVADGRIYTARQAKELKLIDDVVNTYDEAAAQMQKRENLKNCEFYEYRYVADDSLLSLFISSIDKVTEAIASNSDIEAVKSVIEDRGSLSPQYMCEVVK